jgi:PAS domain S-box-containing protein
LHYIAQSNEIRYLLVNATTRRDANNRVVGVVGVAQDVTEAAKHDRAVASMARELRQLVDTANAPIFGIDVLGNVNEWNDKTAEITGFSKEEALSKPLVSTFIVPHLRESVQDVLDKALKGDETSNYQLEFRSKTNEIRYLLVNATTRRDTDSNVVGVVGVAQDVTDDRNHSEELRQMQYVRASQEAKLETERNMTAYFAHELRNPLHAIDSALQLMGQSLSAAQSTELVNSMSLCASFMSSIMNNLLDVRKMEEGKMVLKETPLSLTELVEGVRTMLLPSVRPGVALVTHCDLGDRDWVLGDSHRIQQVLTNVITNAIKYTSSGSIVVSVSALETIVRFECKDTGPGIPKLDQSKLFQRFVQRGGAPGTGLGLAIAKHLVDLKGGKIYFESDPTVKPGTSCIVEMPLDRCEKLETVDVVETQHESSVIEDDISFLIIDDVRMNRTMFRRRFSNFIAPNAKITEASTGEEALEICNERKFDVILVDQHMEEAGGVLLGTDTVVAMRRRKIDSVIVGCSGNDIDNQFMEAGTDWVMKKPTPKNDVIAKKLRQLLGRRQRNRQQSETPSPVGDVPNSEAAKRRLGLSVCPTLGPPRPHFKKRKIV